MLSTLILYLTQKFETFNYIQKVYGLGVAREINESKLISVYEGNTEQHLNLDTHESLSVFLTNGNKTVEQIESEVVANEYQVKHTYPFKCLIYAKSNENVNCASQSRLIADSIEKSITGRQKALLASTQLVNAYIEVKNTTLEKHTLYANYFTGGGLGDNDILIEIEFDFIVEGNQNCFADSPCDNDDFIFDFQAPESFCERVDECMKVPTANGSYVLKILNGVKSWIAATGGGVWGSISGTLSNQTDLQAALNAKEDTITAGTTSQYWRGDKSWQTLNKSAVGLGNVDNTSDSDKPVSNATQQALDQESITRLNADTALSADIITEASARSSGDATLLAMINGLNIPTFSPTAGNTIAEIIDDFAYVAPPIGGASSSHAMSHSGTNVVSITNVVSSLGNQIGVVQCQYNGTGDNTWQMVRTVALGQGEICIGCYMRRPNDSGAANQSNLRFGLRLGAGDGTDGVFFKLNEATNGDQWQCITRASSVSTTSNTSVTTAKSSWVRLFIVVNAAGTEAKFYIDGTLVATHNTNMPAAGTALSGILNMERTVINSIITWLIDYFYIKQTFTTPR